MVLEESIVTDFALVRAAVADRAGNAVFNASACNFNPAAAMAGRRTILEAESLLEVGELDPDAVHLPGVSSTTSSPPPPRKPVSKASRKRTTRRPRPVEGGQDALDA
ncbi:hypothetical protein GCM10009789_12480 [Kribbella sancticallisti]|uniref:Uncharacterized protein n=2 Tax=Kribbella sancticallisti TaxID=460087 RepID=A0ABP4NGN7_9ACTN